MPALMHNIIVAAAADSSTHTVRLAWQNGCETQADFAPLIGQEVFVPLQDPAFFQLVQVTHEGRALSWPGDLEFDADALWFEAHPEDGVLSGEAEAASLAR